MSYNLVRPTEYELQKVVFSLEFAQEYFQQNSKPQNFLVLIRTFKDSLFLIFFMVSRLFFDYYNF